MLGDTDRTPWKPLYTSHELYLCEERLFSLFHINFLVNQSFSACQKLQMVAFGYVYFGAYVLQPQLSSEAKPLVMLFFILILAKFSEQSCSV